MSWYSHLELGAIEKNVCAYLIQRYLGQFFEEKLRQDQLNVDLFKGTGTVEKINLDVEALNNLSETQNWPVEFVDGYIEKLHLTIPWLSVLTDRSIVEVTGLKLTLQPKQRNECATSMMESMWNSSMTTSMQLAEECAKQEAANSPNDTQTFEGIEMFAQTIDSILSKVEVRFIDTVIQLEHVPKDSSSGVGIIINIDLINYSDEAGNDPPAKDPSDQNANDKAYLVQSCTTKKFSIQGMTLSTVEFAVNARTFSPSVINQFKRETDSDDEQFYSAENDEARHVIMFGKFANEQQVTVRLKQSESLSGPKVSIAVSLGPLTMFLSPRQFHVLIELANGLASPDLEDNSNIAPKTRCVTKPMTPLDYQRVEEELRNQLHHPPPNFEGLQGAHGWSAGAQDESDTDENFVPMKNTMGGDMYESNLSGASSSMESSFNSSIITFSTEQTSRTRNRKLVNLDSDPLAEISHFNITIASAVVVLLHEDLLVKSSEQNCILAPASVQQMQKTAMDFFEKIGQLVVLSYGNKDFDRAASVLDSACTFSHLRFLAAPIEIEGNEKTTSTAFSVSGELFVTQFELLECIFSEGSMENISLIKFHETTPTESQTTATPCLKVEFRHVEKTGANNRHVGPRTDLTLSLNKCDVEIDVTLLDRITALLHPEPICVIEKDQSDPWTPFPLETPKPPIESRVNLKISSLSINLKLRFPIPDFRPALDLDRVPWWKRNVRPDYLSLILSEVQAQTVFQTNQSSQEYSLHCRGLEVFYYESENSTPLTIGKAGIAAKVAGVPCDDSLKLTLRMYPVQERIEAKVDIMGQSMIGMFDNQGNKDPGPFTAKRVMHESDTPHSKPQNDQPEEMVIPGDKHEMDAFINSTRASTQMEAEVVLPTLSMQMISKHVYEMIYNRICNDLLLWEPMAPKPKPAVYSKVDLHYDAFEKPKWEAGETFTMCQSGIQYESESDSDDDSTKGQGSIFYSMHENRSKSFHKEFKTENKGQSEFTLSLKIGHGLLCLHTPVRDVSTNNVIPNQHGEFLLNVDNAEVFLVSGYKGDVNLSYVCVQMTNAHLYHCDMISTPSLSPPLKELETAVGRHLLSTIYKSDVGMLANNTKGGGGKRELFTLAVKIQANHETHHVKTVRVALGLNKATLRHRMCNEPNNWIAHLLDFFTVQDYPITGYYAKDVLTELHMNLWDCAIDYRPLNLPLRAAVVLGNFSMSSHLTAQANSSTLRFIAEECGLYLSDKGGARNGVPSAVPVDLKRDYVNVIELGLFELSLKTNDKKSGINPHIDLRASNNILNIHTCSDSGRALMQLITYFANDGDLQNSQDEPSNPSPYSSPLHHAEEELVQVEQQDISNLSASQHQHVNQLLDEAMADTIASKTQPIDPNSQMTAGAKLYYFPGENQLPLPDETLNAPVLQVTCELGDYSNKSSDTDDDFCIIGDDAVGVMSPNSLPEIKWLTNDAVRVVDGHFSVPIQKTDILQPPKGFPMPVLRYTLCEMSIVWQMYGGSDFDSSNVDKKKVNFSDLKLDEKVSFSNTPNRQQVFVKKAIDRKRNSMSWIVRGGANRDHNVLMELQLNKIRFQHEVYPETTKQASRQILVISNVEIRDRLECSQINKFLYQYTSQQRPKQSHAHMVVIKAVHIRPNPKLKAQECSLKISLLPLRLNIDQDSLLFLIAFFNELGAGNSESDEMESSFTSKQSTPTHHPPIMTINEDNEELVKQQAHKMVDENLLILLEENKEEEKTESVVTEVASGSDDSPVYFRYVKFSPEVLIKLDYHGKRLDMTHGSLAGLLMGLGQLNFSEVKLKRITHKHGLLGFAKLISYLLQEWLNDIKRNQLGSLLGGVGPMHALVQLVQGIRDLFWLPIEQYQKDGRIVRGLQRGANSFTTSTALACLELTSRLIHLIQITAETAYDMLSPGPSVRKIRSRGKRKNPPQDIREGVANAYMLVKEGIGETAGNIVQVASHEHEQKGYSGAVGGVLRELPSAMIKPVILASAATNNLLSGMTCQLVPDARLEANQKWRRNDE